MSAGHLLAVDAGTGSCRAVLFDRDGRQVAVAQREWSHPPVAGAPRVATVRHCRQLELICGCIREVLSGTGVDPREIAAVSATSMREGIVLYDDDGRRAVGVPQRRLARRQGVGGS